MAITIKSEQIYLAGKTRTTPQGSGSLIYCEAGYAGNSPSYRYATLYTCNTTTPLSQITISARMCGTLGTDVNNAKYLGIYVTTAKNDKYLTESTGGDTKFCFSYTCVDDGTPTKNPSGTTANTAIGTITKNIPKGDFYIYVVPYSASSKTTYSTFYSKDSTTSPITVTGTSIPIYKATLNNQSATTAGTSAIWYVYNTYFSPYYYYTDSTCTTGLASSKITVPAKTGYTFGGYYTSTGGGGTQYITAAGAVNTSLYKVNKNQTLYAKWTGNQYTMKIDPTGGEYNGSTTVYTLSTKLQYGATTLSSIKVATRPGYTLKGYYTAASGGTKVYNADGTCVTGTTYWNTSGVYRYAGNLTLYAQWSASGFVYIDNGTSFDTYQVYIDNGTSWDLYITYIDNGTSWDMY